MWLSELSGGSLWFWEWWRSRCEANCIQSVLRVLLPDLITWMAVGGSLLPLNHGRKRLVLMVVEPGFNSARALEEARLLISQMSNVQAVGFCLSVRRCLRSSVHR